MGFTYLAVPSQSCILYGQVIALYTCPHNAGT